MDKEIFTLESASEILDKFKDNILNHKKYRILYSRTLMDYWNRRINKNIFFAIYFKTEELDNINLGNINRNIQKIDKALLQSNYIEINVDGEIVKSYFIESKTRHDVRTRLKELSRNNCVFFFGKDGVDKYINGDSVNDVNIFYTASDLKRYSEKHHISELPQVIEEYAKKYIPQQCDYMCFFAEDALLKRIDSSLIPKNILRNKPEKYMRDHLLNYLNDNMQHTFVKEPELIHSKRELDIYTEDNDSSLLFIEIKWLGTSINEYGTALGTKYTNARAREGVKQSLEYIDELNNTPGTSLRCGYLAIFDARDEKKEIDFDDYTYIEEPLKKYLQVFDVLPIIPLKKNHSA